MQSVRLNRQWKNQYIYWYYKKEKDFFSFWQIICTFYHANFISIRDIHIDSIAARRYDILCWWSLARIDWYIEEKFKTSNPPYMYVWSKPKQFESCSRYVAIQLYPKLHKSFLPKKTKVEHANYLNLYYTLIICSSHSHLNYRFVSASWWLFYNFKSSILLTDNLY